MVKSQRKSGMTDIYGKLFDEKKPAVISVFLEKGQGKHRLCIFLPLTFGKFSWNPEGSVHEAFKNKGFSYRSPAAYSVADGRYTPGEHSDPAFVGQEAQGQIPPESVSYKIDICEGGLVSFDILNYADLEIKPAGVAIWLNRTWGVKNESE